MAAISTTWRTERTLDFAIKNNSDQEGLFSNSRTACDSRCSSTTRKKGSRYYPPCATWTRWYFPRLPVDLVTKTDGQLNLRTGVLHIRK
ncbi:unnamed protein product [Hymenolepis diminuta]|uniref:Uncharacterized protein n=1 Tax=Hymenolepis diminuta TaxID=6216 RepID=A0A564XUG2_HYMDI|nr:unnamed protein product [Hymenolepis diminuta]